VDGEATVDDAAEEVPRPGEAVVLEHDARSDTRPTIHHNFRRITAVP
jgi:hypothetical protein